MGRVAPGLPTGYVADTRFSRLLPAVLCAISCICFELSAGEDGLSSAYLFVFDRSGSMDTPTPAHKTRWEELQDRAVEFAQYCKLNSIVWIAVFSDKVESVNEFKIMEPADRQAVQRFIVTYRAPTNGETALYDAWGRALEHAERLAQGQAIRFTVVKVFTDGEDNRSKTWNKTSIDAKIAQLEKENRKLVIRLNKVPPPEGSEGGAVRRLVDVDISPAELKLPSPKQNPKQTVKLTLGISEDWQAVLQRDFPNVPLSGSVEFIPKPSSPVSLATSKWTCPLGSAAGDLALEVAGADALRPDAEYQASLRIAYPRMKGVEFIGKTEIPVLFQKSTFDVADADVKPRDGSTFPVGRPILFEVNTLQSAKILWNFGDGAGTGPQLCHTYNKPGDVQVTVSVDAGAIGKIEKKLTLHIDSLDVFVNKPAGLIFAGTELKLTCTGTGDIRKYKWLVDGDELAGAPGFGDQCPFTFIEPGRHSVRVIASSERSAAMSRELSLDVLPKPSVQIVEPQAGKTFTYGEKVLFKASVQGPIRAVNFSLTPKGAAAPVFKVERPVDTDKDQKRSTMEYTFEEAAGITEVEVTASAVLAEGVAIEVAPYRIPLRIDAQGRAIRLISPAPGAKLMFGQPVRFEAEVIGPNMDQVRWTIEGKGRPEPLLDKPSNIAQEGNRRIARLEHTFEEGLSGLDAVVRVAGVLPEALKAKAPVDSQSFRIEPPQRAVRIVKPAQGERVPFAKEIVFEAEVEGPGIDQVSWSLATKDQPQLVPAAAASVAAEGGKRVARLKHTWPESPTDLDVTAKVAAILPDNLKAAGPIADERQFTVCYPEVKAEIVCPAATIPWGTQPSFSIKTDQDIVSITWDFGDGTEPLTVTNLNPVPHKFEKLGLQSIKARVVGKGGKAMEVTANPKVVAEELKAAAKPFPAKIHPDMMLELKDQSTGPVVGSRWVLGGQPLEKGAASVALKTLGLHTLELIVTGPPGLDGKPVESRATFPLLAVRRPEWVRFLVVAVPALLLFFLVCWYFLGNKFEAWTVEWTALDPSATAKDLRKHLDTKAEDYGPPKTIGKLGFWSRWCKKGVVPMRDLIKTSPHWTRGQGKGVELKLGTAKGTLTPQEPRNYAFDGDWVNNQYVCVVISESWDASDKEDQTRNVRLRLTSRKDPRGSGQVWIILLAGVVLVGAVVWWAGQTLR